MGALTKRNPFHGASPLVLAFVVFAALVLLSTLGLAVYAAFFVDLGALSRALQALVFISVFIAIWVLQTRGAANHMLQMGLSFLEKVALADPKLRRVDEEQPQDNDSER